MMIAFPHLSWQQWCIAALGAFLVGVSKTGIAGVGIVSVALFPLVWAGKGAVGIALLILICADVVAITAYPPKNVRWDIWRSAFPWAMLGVLFGAVAMRYITDASMVKQVIGGILLLIVVLQSVLRAKRKNPKAAPESAKESLDVAPKEVVPPIYQTALAGILTGIATMIANAAGPVMILYLLPRKLPKVEFIATTAWFFFALNLFKVPFSYGAGMMDAASPITAALLLPAAVVGGLTGKWLLPRIEQNAFEFSALILTALASLRLLLG